jgi:hypothetical protein
MRIERRPAFHESMSFDREESHVASLVERAETLAEIEALAPPSVQPHLLRSLHAFHRQGRIALVPPGPLDDMPFSIHLGVGDGSCVRILDAGTALPARLTIDLERANTGAELEVAVYAGEGAAPADLSLLGASRLMGLPKDVVAFQFVPAQIEVSRAGILTLARPGRSSAEERAELSLFPS